MNRILLSVAILLFIFPIIVFSQNGQKPGAVRTIIVDAGHGGYDTGAPGMVTNEATVNLQVALKLAKALRDELPAVKIMETRTTSALPGNSPTKDAANRWRADFANRNAGDLFISIHCNAAGRRPGGWYEKRVVGSEARTRYVKKGKKKVKQTYYIHRYQDFWVENKAAGTETYIWAVGKNDQKVTSISNNDDYYQEEEDTTGTLKMPDMNDPAEKARMLLYAQHYFRKSYNLASLVENEFVANGRNSRGVQQRNHKGIWVLQATGMPSILIEIGFISNKEEEQYLMSEAGQSAIVSSIVKAVKAYINKGNTVSTEN